MFELITIIIGTIWFFSAWYENHQVAKSDRKLEEYRNQKEDELIAFQREHGDWFANDAANHREN